MMIRVKNRKVIARLSRRNLLHNRTRNAVAVFAIALTTLLFTALVIEFGEFTSSDTLSLRTTLKGFSAELLLVDKK